MKKLTKLFILFLIPLLLCSCWDYTDINKKAVVLSVGVDYDTTTDNYIFSGEAANFSPPSAQQAVKRKKLIYLIIHHKVPLLKMLSYNNDNSVPMPMFLGGTTVVIFGKSLAEKSIEPYLNRIDGIIDYRKTLLAVVSKESPEELFKYKNK